MTRRDWLAFLLAMLGLCCSLAGGQEPEINLLEIEPGAYSLPGVIIEGANLLVTDLELDELVIGIDKDGHYVLREGVVHGACESEVAELRARIAELEARLAEPETRILFKPFSSYWDGCNWVSCDAAGSCSSTSLACPGEGVE